MKKINYWEFIENNIIECNTSCRGGSLKVDVSELFKKLDNPSTKMTKKIYLYKCPSCFTYKKYTVKKERDCKTKNPSCNDVMSFIRIEK